MRVEPMRAVQQKVARTANGQQHARRQTLSAALEHPAGGDPAWEVALCLPPQGRWTEEDYGKIERLRQEHFPLLELSHGRLELRPMPTLIHQLIQRYMQEVLEVHVREHAPGTVLPAGYKVRLEDGGHRAPDIIYVSEQHFDWLLDKWCTGADLVVEIVSDDPKDQRRDYKEKLADYAKVGVAEYWLVDPKHRKVTVFVLKGRKYSRHGVFKPGKSATSVLLKGFNVPVDKLLNPPMVLKKRD